MLNLNLSEGRREDHETGLACIHLFVSFLEKIDFVRLFSFFQLYYYFPRQRNSHWEDSHKMRVFVTLNVPRAYAGSASEVFSS